MFSETFAQKMNSFFFLCQKRNIGHFKQTNRWNAREVVVESNDVIENTF